MNAFVKGFTSFFLAFGFVFSKKISHWYLIPVILYLVLIVGLSFSISSILFPYVSQVLNSVFKLGLSAADSEGLSTFKTIAVSGLGFILSLAIKLLLWYFFSRIMKYIILIILSPLLAYFSEKAEELKYGKKYPFSLSELINNTARGILITLRNLFIESGLIVLGFVLSFFIPVLAPLIAVLLFTINCYFMGFSMFDYISERKRMDISQSVRKMRANRSKVFGLGLAYNLISFIPIADWVIAPVNGAVGAVLADSESNY